MLCTLHESELPELAISIRQPWAHAIVMGWKDIENRKWSTRHRGLVCIHASAYNRRNFDEDYGDYLEVVQGFVKASPHNDLASISESDLSFGAIIGVARVVEVSTSHDSPWFFGRYGFVLADQQRLENPIPLKGALGFFEWRERLPTAQAAAEPPKQMLQPAQGSLF